LAEALVARSPRPLAGASVLDLGAGTGAASRAVTAVGGSVVAVDLSREMLRHEARVRPPAAVGDATVLPLRDDVVDAVVAACSVSHVPDPKLALAEAARVTRPAGVVLASVFSARSGHPAKDQVDAVARSFGYEPPAWYRDLKSTVEPLTASIDALFDVARAVGLVDVVVVERGVDVEVRDAETLVAWRSGMAQLAPFVEALDPEERARFLADAVAAVGEDAPPFVPRLLILSARAPSAW
jgi:SAM-dependent methyltransferase